MNFYDLNCDDSVDITEDMEKAFKTVIREAIKKCWSVGNWGEGEFRDHLMFRTSYGRDKTIGCIDGDYLILSSDFFYERLCMYWEKWLSKHENTPRLPLKYTFYKALYYNGILPHGIFFQKPLYQLSVDDESAEDDGWYFFIRPEYIGFKSSMVEWH